MRYDMLNDPRYQQLNVTEQLVLHLINWFDGNGEGCWRSAPTLAQNMNVDVRTVRRALATLTKLELITTRHEGTRVYRAVNTATPSTAATPDTSVTPVTHDTVPLTPVSPTPDISVTPPLTPVSPKENKNITNKNTIRELLLQVVGLEVANDFIDHRKSVKSPLTERAAKLIVNKLRNHHDPEAVINLSIENGWKGIFPDQIKMAGEKRKDNQTQIMEDWYADRTAALEDNHNDSWQGTFGIEDANADQFERESRLSATVHMLRAK